MTCSPVHFSNETEEWGTPLPLFRALDAEFGFTLDPCATPMNAKCPRYFTRDDDGLSQPWDGVVYVNPPYGRNINHWIEKAYAAAENGATVVCFVPARTDRAWWHDYVMKAAEVRFIRGRVRFEGAKSFAPFTSCVVIFDGSDGPPRFTSMDREPEVKR